MKSGSLLALTALLALLLMTGALSYTWWERSQTPPTELLVEVLPEEILEVKPPDWDALASEMDDARSTNTPGGEPGGTSPPAAGMPPANEVTTPAGNQDTGP
jgi:hypothetical protein